MKRSSMAKAKWAGTERKAKSKTKEGVRSAQKATTMMGKGKVKQKSAGQTTVMKAKGKAAPPSWPDAIDVHPLSLEISAPPPMPKAKAHWVANIE